MKSEFTMKSGGSNLTQSLAKLMALVALLSIKALYWLRERRDFQAQYSIQ